MTSFHWETANLWKGSTERPQQAPWLPKSQRQTAGDSLFVRSVWSGELSEAYAFFHRFDPVECPHLEVFFILFEYLSFRVIIMELSPNCLMNPLQRLLKDWLKPDTISHVYHYPTHTVADVSCASNQVSLLLELSYPFHPRVLEPLL